jgi:hypothetical protein
MSRKALSDVLSEEAPLIEHGGATLCLACLMAGLGGSICAYEFEDSHEEEAHCEGCKRWGDRVFRLVPREVSSGVPEAEAAAG